MANSLGRLKAAISKNIKEICEFEIDRSTIDFFTITDVIVSDDHSYAKVMVSFFTDPEKNIKKLNNKKGVVRSMLAKRLDTRRVPEVFFEVDDTFKKQQEFEELLERAKNKSKN